MTALSNGAGGSYELAGPEILSYDDIVRTTLRASGRRRRLLHVPLPVVRATLRAARVLAGTKVFATWEEAELLEEPMVTERGTEDAETLGVKPLRMAAVLGAR
jgi:NADH dehydrogenase